MSNAKEPLRSVIWEVVRDFVEDFPATTILLVLIVIALTVVTIVFWPVAWIIWLSIGGLVAFFALCLLLVAAFDEW